jgi:[protein-PII] uridylyltransferase
MMAPPLLRWRTGRLRAQARGATPTGDGNDPGTLVVVGDRVVLGSEPSAAHALAVVLEGARLCATHVADQSLLDWVAAYPPEARRFDERARREFCALLREGSSRSWRLLAMSSVLERALPEVAEAFRARTSGHAFDIEPFAPFETPRLVAARENITLASVADADAVLLAALVLDASDGVSPDAPAIARRSAARLGMGSAAEQRVWSLLADVELVPAAARRGDAFDHDAIAHLAMHLGSTDQVRALQVLRQALEGGAASEHDRTARLYDAVQREIAQRSATSTAADDVAHRRATAVAMTDDAEVRERINAAPVDYVLQVRAADLARQAALCEPTPGRDDVRVAVHCAGDSWVVEIAARDRFGLMARVAHVFAERDLTVVGAVAATYGDETAIESYRVVSVEAPDPDDIANRLRALRREALVAPAVPDAVVDFDDAGSPWASRCTVEAGDRPGLLQAVTAAFAHAGVSVRAAKVTTEGGTALDSFDLTLRDGRKLDRRAKQRVVAALQSGTRIPTRSK